jgi:hypothetical protein
MPRLSRFRFIASLVAAPLALLGADAIGQADALSLESAPVEKLAATGSTSNFFVEGAIGNAAQRYRPGSVDTGRLSLDFSYSGKFGPEMRFTLSDRIDAIHPKSAPGADTTINSLREAYLSWQPEGGNTVVDLGRVNVRSGPGYGYNPTDFFRDGSLRVITSADPFALRQNRIGSVMLRAQRLWGEGSLSFAYSPKLDSRPSTKGWSVDLGSTNSVDRGLMTLGTKLSDKINSQVLLYKEEGRSLTVGANMSALVSDAATVHLEWSHGREPDLVSRALPVPVNQVTRSRLVGGATYTTLGKTSITAEYQYNGFGLKNSEWSALSAVPGAQLGYLRESLRRLELAPRQAFLLYVTQKGLVLKDLDLTGYVRFNLEDSSKLAWLELRHHWSKFDLTFQLQQNIGRANSEFGLLPDRRVVQVLGTYYF